MIKCHRCNKETESTLTANISISNGDFSLNRSVFTYFCSEVCQDSWVDRVTRKNLDRVCDYCKLECLDFYVVLDSIWLSVMESKKGHLHLGCLEAKLGRC